MQRQFQQFVEFQLHADLGTHSANCAADSGDLTSTVLWWLLTCLLLCNGRCFGWVVQKTVESPQWQFWVRPVPGQGCCARRCNDCGPCNAWFDYGYMFCIIQGSFWKNSRCLGADAWFDIGYIFCVSSRRASWTISHIFYVKVELWILWSILASSCIMAEEEVAAFVVNSGSGMHSAGFCW